MIAANKNSKKGAKELILHIGHHKTGSSYLQSVFALNVPLFNQANIGYPYDKSFEWASKGYISSGNGLNLSIENIEAQQQNKLLFSSERLFKTLLNDDDLLTTLSANYQLKIILYTRDVVEYMISRWLQTIKRTGFIGDVDSFLMSQPIGAHHRVIDWIDKAKSLGFDLIIKNYTKNRNRLVSIFFADAFNNAINPADLKLPHIEQVNRGLTNFECELQRVFNAIDGNKSARYISDFLVNAFPNSTSHSVKISQQTYDVIVKENSMYINKINEYMSSDEQILFGDESDFVRQNDYSEDLTNDMVIALAENIKKHTALNPNIAVSSDTLRDLALKIEQGNKLDLKDALSLMQTASAIRPNELSIKNKIDEWTSKLDESSK